MNGDEGLVMAVNLWANGGWNFGATVAELKNGNFRFLGNKVCE